MIDYAEPAPAPAPTPAVETLGLGHGLWIDCRFPSLDSVETSVRFRRRVLFRHRFHAGSPLHEHHLVLGLVRLGLGLESDMFSGALMWRFELAWRPWPGRPWRPVVKGKDRVLVAFDPCLGEVAGSTEACPPQVDDPAFGRSRSCTPTILRIHVEEGHRDLCRVGALVKASMFPEHPPFVFNTVACVGDFAEGEPGLYGDPHSTWFNIFLGYYQLDCPKKDWSRPFGYRSASGEDAAPEPDDLARLGKSDWNWFSNWNYGVPADALLPYSKVDMGQVGFSHRGLVSIGRSKWHEVELQGVEVASCYVAPGGRLVRNTILDGVWRASFGAPCPRADWTTSFVPTVVDALVDMAYWEDEASYHTVLFGGTAARGADPRFLQAQLAATRAVIADRYPQLGFA